jgi:hypothetical protein
MTSASPALATAGALAPSATQLTDRLLHCCQKAQDRSISGAAQFPKLSVSKAQCLKGCSAAWLGKKLCLVLHNAMCW